MSVIRRPHMLAFEPVTEEAGMAVDYGDAVDVRGQLTPERFGDHMERDTGRALDSPHLFLFNLSDRTSVGYGYRATDGLGRKFKVMTDVKVWNSGDGADHCSVILERLELTP